MPTPRTEAPASGGRATTSAAAVEVVHRLGRRVHLRAPSLAHQRAACQRVADRLAGEFAGHRIGVRPPTGSVIVEAERGTAPVEVLADRLAQLVGSERADDGRPLLERLAAPRRAPSDLARAVIGAVRGVNDDVRAALEGKADIATLAPVVLAVSSTFQVLRHGKIQPVPWFNLLWFSLRSFVAFNADPHVASPEPPIDPRPSDPLAH